MSVKPANTVTGIANVQNAAYNCVITNVPGPQQPLYSMGAKLMTMIGFGLFALLPALYTHFKKRRSN